VTTPAGNIDAALRRRGILLEWVTLGWNIIGVIVLAVTAWRASSVALAGFGLDSLIEIGASTVVLWELAGTPQTRQRRGLKLIGFAFIALALYLLIQSGLALAVGHHAQPSPAGITWTAVTAAVMFTLAWAKTRTGTALRDPVLCKEGHVTFIDGVLALAVLIGLLLNGLLGWWWADSAAGLVIVYYATREAWDIFRIELGNTP
jgi:divalent metal cation (Fe/Co/Zn/Cd) transporter